MFLQEKINEINEKLKVLEDKTNIAVWGAGVHTCKLFEKTELLTYHVKYVVDIDDAKKGIRYFGFTINKPDEAAWDNIGAVVVSVPGKEKQITEMLVNQFGFRGIIICFYENGRCMPFYQLYDENIPEVRYLGDYGSWGSARDECKGYDDSVIIDKVINSTRKVLDGDAVWERDSYLFYEPKYVYSICAAILRCAVQKKDQSVRILDIGGALGSTYFQNRVYLEDVKLEYVIAEQDSFVKYGKSNLENDILKFISSTENYTDYGKFDIILMSASLQYISYFQEIVSKIVSARPHYIILDRILVGGRTRICIEEVPKEIYKSSYPVMIYTENEIMEFFGREYELIEKDISSVPEEVYFEDGKADSRYYVFCNIQSTEHQQ